MSPSHACGSGAQFAQRTRSLSSGRIAATAPLVLGVGVRVWAKWPWAYCDGAAVLACSTISTLLPLVVPSVPTE